MADLLQELYEKYEILSSSGDKISEHSSEYLQCIKGIKGDTKEKKLAAQIISKYFKHFPNLQDQGLNAILDLCEDGDSDIRICAMKALPNICRDNKEYVTNIASILSQLLQLEDQDYVVANNSLLQVFGEDQINTVKGIFSNVYVPSDENIKERCIQFLYKKLPNYHGKLSNEIVDLLIEEGKKIIQVATSEEFIAVMSYLVNSKLSKDPTSQAGLVDIIAEKIEINDDFNPLDETADHVNRAVLCVSLSLPLFNDKISSAKFVTYYCMKILPHFDSIGTIKLGQKLQLQILKQLAELSVHCGDVENITEIVGVLFNKLKEYMPYPPDDINLNEVPDLNFAYVECLLYAFHRLARKCPEFLTGDPDLLKDFRARLQYFSRGVRGCQKGLAKTSQVKTANNANEEENEAVKDAPIVLENIITLIKDLFYQPPLYKCNVNLSFKQKQKTKDVKKITAPVPTVTGKRHIPITFDSNNKQKRSDERAIYTPPSGKFSSNFGWKNNSSNSNYRRRSTPYKRN